MERILLLEDDKSLVTGLTLALGRAGYALDTARTLAEAGHLWQAGRYDLLMLDVTLPDGTGFDFCREVRRTSGVPILFLTASDEEMDIITGLGCTHCCAGPEGSGHSRPPSCAPAASG